jgi:hypothetical protein
MATKTEDVSAEAVELRREIDNLRGDIGRLTEAVSALLQREIADTGERVREAAGETLNASRPLPRTSPGPRGTRPRAPSSACGRLAPRSSAALSAIRSRPC